MLRRTFLKAVVAATGAAAAAKLPAFPALTGIERDILPAGPVQMGHAWLMREGRINPDDWVLAEWSKTPIWCNDPNWRENMRAGAQIRIGEVDFGCVQETANYVAVLVILDPPPDPKLRKFYRTIRIPLISGNLAVIPPATTPPVPIGAV